jgi:hypothetical protein
LSTADLDHQTEVHVAGLIDQIHRNTHSAPTPRYGLLPHRQFDALRQKFFWNKVTEKGPIAIIFLV